jgi:hypothetical protein
LQVNVTLVDELKFRDDIEANIWEVVLEHAEEHGQKMRDCPACGQQWFQWRYANVLILAQNWSEAADLSAKGSADMLRGVSDKFLDARHDFRQESLLIEQGAET